MNKINFSCYTNPKNLLINNFFFYTLLFNIITTVIYQTYNSSSFTIIHFNYLSENL